MAADDEGGQALVKREPAPALKAARSIEQARPGEVIFLNRRGQVVAPHRVAAIKLFNWGIIAGSWIVVGVLYGSWFGPLVGVAGGLGMAAITGFQLRHWPAFRAACSLYINRRWEEAYVAFKALEGKGLPRTCRHAVTANLGALEWLLGRPQEALPQLDRAIAQLRGRSGVSATLTRFSVGCTRAGLLARLGRLDEARRQRDELVQARATGKRMQRGEYFGVLLQHVELAIAFEADAPGELPDDATLHEWARAALLRTQFGEQLVSLAWAFHRRGDDDMARHLLAEAPLRIARPSLPTTAPRLHAWAEERRAAWGIGAEASEPGAAS